MVNSMNARELFDMLMEFPQPTRTEVLEALETLTRNYNQEYTEALLADFEELLNDWKYTKVVTRLKSEYNVKVLEPYQAALHAAEYALAMGCNGPIDWPEEPAPFIPPLPGCYDDSLIFVASMYEYAVEVLRNKTVIETSTGDINSERWRLPRELDTPSARKYFGRAIERGFLKQTSIGFEWIRETKKGEGVNTLIALLGGMIYCGDEVVKSRYGDKWKLGKDGVFPDEELKQLFGLKSLGAIRTNGLDSSREKTAPRGWEDIVALFEV